MSDCIFCKIVRGDIPCVKVYENEDILAFEDIKPMAPVHVIVVPKRHFSTLMDVDDQSGNVAQALLAASRKVAEIKGVAEKGFRVVTNCNADGGQVVFHLHLHVLGGRKLADEMG